MSQTVYWAAAQEVEVRLTEVYGETTLVEFAVNPGIRMDYMGGAIFGGPGAGTAVGFGTTAMLGSVTAVSPGGRRHWGW